MRKTICLAIMMSLAMTMPTLAAGWEQRQDGAWVYREEHGSLAYNQWKTGADGTYYYIGSNGIMVTDSLIEDQGEFYYLDSQGRMAANQWVKLFDDESEMERWYYFKGDGAAYRSKGGSKAVLRDIGGADYIFDEDGRMAYGWVNRDGSMADAEDPTSWRDAVYYCGTEDEGWVVTGWKRLQVDYAQDSSEEKLKKKWFYFQESGRKRANAKDVRLSAPNGKEYVFAFDKSGVMTSQKSTTPSEPKDQSKWTERVPSASQSSDDNSGGIKRWFYTRKDGSKVKDKIEKIDGKYYCFDEAGIMRSGLVAVKDNKYVYTIHNTNPGDDLCASIDDLCQAMDDGYTIMYFDEATGARKTGKVSVELVEGKQTMRFSASGKAIDGAYDGYLYDSGVLMKAEDDTQVFTVNGKEYTVNKSGRIQ